MDIIGIIIIIIDILWILPGRYEVNTVYTSEILSNHGDLVSHAKKRKKKRDVPFFSEAKPAKSQL